jgi:hypothetical protein
MSFYAFYGSKKSAVGSARELPTKPKSGLKIYFKIKILIVSSLTNFTFF